MDLTHFRESLGWRLLAAASGINFTADLGGQVLGNLRNNRGVLDFDYGQAAGAAIGGAAARTSAGLRYIRGNRLDIAEGLGVAIGAATLGK